MNIPIISEDDYLLVIEKPTGIVVNRAESVVGETIQDWSEIKLGIKNLEYKTEEEKDFYNRAGIVHRLDKETSGLLLIAKTPQAFFNLQSQFKERKVIKKYTALVHGNIAPPEGVIKATVGRLPWNRERFGILPGGREAVTTYKLLKLLKSPLGEPLSFLEVTPLTGRTHQIRIHLKYIGRPIVSDSFYGGRKTYRRDKMFCPRLFLHAGFIQFRHPFTGKEIEFKSELPLELKEVLNKTEELKNL